MEEQGLMDGPQDQSCLGQPQPVEEYGNRTYVGERESEATLTPVGLRREGLPGPATRNINIRALHHGYVVEVGCQQVAIESVDKLLKALESYLKDPVETERLYSNRELL